jgi:mono/diheme cytochrome c family protein
VVAFSRKDGSIVRQIELPAATNSPIAIAGDTLIAGAGLPHGKNEKAQVVAYRIGATPPATTSTTATAPTTSPATTSAGAGAGAPSAAASGKAIFSANCASCHTLAAAGAGGTVGPNLDQLTPSTAVVSRQVINGGGAMPSFSGTLTDAEIQAVATYVSSVAGKKGAGGTTSTQGFAP